MNPPPPWLTGLDEDWIPEAQLSTGSLSKSPSNSFRRSVTSSTSLPDLQQRSPIAQQKHPRRSSDPSQIEETEALADRLPSRHNTRVMNKQTHLLNDQSSFLPETSVRITRRASGLSTPLIGSTIQTRPVNKVPGDSFPEWRRRIMMGEESGDLFGPIGLERIFLPPSNNESYQTKLPASDNIGQSWSHPPDPPPHGVPVSSNLEGRSSAGSGTRLRNRFGIHQRGSNSRKIRYVSSTLHALDLSHDGSSLLDSRLRTVSGREEIRNESISPVLLPQTPRLINNWKNGTLDVPLRPEGSLDKSVSLQPRSPEQSSRLSDPAHYHYSIEDDEHGGPEDALGMTSQSLPEDLSMGTQDFISNGFVNSRRGGYSNEGSFLTRRLSPSSFLSQAHSSSFLRSSNIRSSPPSNQRRRSLRNPKCGSDMPSANINLDKPKTERSQAESSEARPLSRGSPLKLFGNYDTYTNEKLLRRMSQFEESFEESLDDAPPSPSQNRQRAQISSQKKRNAQTQSASSSQQQQNEATSDTQIEHSASLQDHSSFSPVLLPTLLAAEGGGISVSHQSQHKSRGRQNHTTARQESKPNALFKPVKSDGPSKGRDLEQRGIKPPSAKRIETKRVLNSPTKDLNPKRRRTLQRSLRNDDDDEIEIRHDPAIDLTFQSSYFGSTIMGKGHLDTSELAIPSEQHAFYKPQPTTPTSRQNQHAPTDHLGVGSKRDTPSPNMVNGTSQQFDNARPRGMGQLSIDTSLEVDDNRTDTMTTQLYLDQAMYCMDQIRSKPPRSGLTSVLETNAVSDEEYDDVYFEESSLEEFSRPPSREGIDLRELRQLAIQNPRIVSHLKKFEDKDDHELFMSASVMSLRLKKDRNRPTLRAFGDEHGDSTTSSPKDNQLRPQHSSLTSSADSAHAAETRRSNGTSGLSGPRGSSSKSGMRWILSPDKFSNLISDQTGKMVFDQTAQRWVRSPANAAENRRRGLPDVASEDDPFVDISDLSVDELQELMAIKGGGVSSRGKSPPEVADTTLKDHTYEVEGVEGFRQPSDTRPRTRDGHAALDSSSVQSSKSTHFTASGPKPDTRATSWATEELTGIQDQTIGGAAPNGVQQPGEASRERRMNDEPRSNVRPQSSDDRKQARAPTITFSSPLVNRVGYQDESSVTESGRLENEQPLPITPPGRHSSCGDNLQPCVSDAHTDSLPSSRERIPSARITPRCNSIDGRPFIGRPVSRIDEESENSRVNESAMIRQDDLSVVQAAGNEERSIILPETANHDTTYSFYLSPLPDFTFHQMDESMKLEVSYIAQRTHPESMRQVHGTFALASEELVKHITDVQPYEIYWEHLRKLDLQGKNLITLRKLNEFCSRLEELDVSHNNIGQLSGVPATVRSLKIQQNCLSNLTPWGHLSNLQYLDVSGNDLETLDGFAGLVHLRSLKANNNRIENIDGVLGLNGLLSLKLRGNKLQSVDFGKVDLARLTELDLSGNSISSVLNLDALCALESLDLRDNKIQNLNCSLIPNLHSLKLSSNNLESLDISPYPSLRLLYADKNHLSTISGLEHRCLLEILAIREQTLPPRHRSEGQQSQSLQLDLSSAIGLRKLFLSANTLSPEVLCPPTILPNLQFMDLASCALENLPPGFGTMFPNLAGLNLNFNALSDIAGLQGISRLSKLSLVGNRLVRLRRLCQVLRLIGGRAGTLKTVDLRGNPITVGFYPSLVSGSGRYRGLFSTRKDGHPTKHDQDKQLARIDNHQEDGAMALATLGGCVDIARRGFPDEIDLDGENGQVDTVPREIDDPYTIPAADAVDDRKYLAHLDEATKLRRRVVEVMVQAAASGRLKTLDGLVLDGAGEGRVKKDEVWRRLKELGVVRVREKA
ncbi:hypothetical protein AJ80_04985 [Polytolypa hystricis UAMH7299]|uniref:Septation initiation network scaffold protein cdc11 n=1 Tax=Polytolypa hystricis (strain UAMH7299) TaxID=1447883 RepID=A0A2B7Y7C8_POLH7|nr:hypothetical protein AJ80_04985 [Polytolypa hystricis UAMH7299]